MGQNGEKRKHTIHRKKAAQGDTHTSLDFFAVVPTRRKRDKEEA